MRPASNADEKGSVWRVNTHQPYDLKQMQSLPLLSKITGFEELSVCEDVTLTTNTGANV